MHTCYYKRSSLLRVRRVLATSLLLACFFWLPASAKPKQRPPVPVETAKTEVTSMAARIVAVGSMRSNEAITIRSEIAGRVTSIDFKEGQPVSKGQLLLTLDGSIYKAELTQAKARLRLAKRSFERLKGLFAKKISTAKLQDEALSRMQVGVAVVDLANARLQKTRILAPFSGITGLRKISVGDYISIGQDIAGLENIDPIKVDFRISEKYLAAVRTGQAIRVRVDAYEDKEFVGRVYAIDPRIDAAGRSIVVRARIPNSDRLLRPGLFARVNLVLDLKPNTLTVPEQAIMPRGKEHFVYTVVAGKAKQIKVRIGIRRNGRVEIIKGLVNGDTVVTAGHLKIRNGSRVTVVRTANGA